MEMRIPQRRRRDLAVPLCIGLLPAPTAADTVPTPPVAVELPDLNAKERAWAQDPTLISGPLRIGFGRPVPVARALRALAPTRWQQTADGGHLLAVRLRSPDALGLRIAVQTAARPIAALLGFFDAEGTVAALFSGAELNAVHGPFWSPLLQGESALITIALPPGYDPAATVIALPQVSHLVRNLFDDVGTGESVGNPCRLDVACHPGWERASRATALLLYTDRTGGTGSCTGTLLRDADPTTDVPYVVTARHCVPDQGRASSIEAVWFHRGARCGDRTGLPVRAVSGGAELLRADALTDISLLRLRRPVPPGPVFADWSVGVPGLDTVLASVHQQQGLRQAIALGRVTAMVPCAEVPLCEGEGADDEGHYLRVRWEQGGTDIGSSGSGLFLPTGALVGVLSGGYGDCEGTPGPDHYGRFDLAYRAGLRRWLGPAMARRAATQE